MTQPPAPDESKAARAGWPDRADPGVQAVQLHGPAPLSARLGPWMRDLLADAAACADLLNEHASPVNLIDTTSLERNVDELHSAAEELGVDLFVQVARKANKALAIVDEARDRGYGIDVGSEAELRQVLARGVDPARVVVTAAVKPRSLMQLCLSSGALVALDNLDEADLLCRLAEADGVTPRVALRLQPPVGVGGVPSRFGEQIEAWGAWLTDEPPVRVIGLHFHLHGYSAQQRAQMLHLVFAALDEGVFAERIIEFIDIGGGIPMSYLDDAAEWQNFWALHHELLATESPLTWQANPLTNVYPYHQELVRGPWLTQLLQQRADDAEADTAAGRSVAQELVAREIQLRCEPGRAVLDGVGMTLARVSFRKHTSDGTFVVGLEMNRTQCRSTSDDFLVDPYLVRAPGGVQGPGGAHGPDGSDDTDARRDAGGTPTTGRRDAYLVGAYCIENELLLTRRVQVPDDIAVGDVVAFPNTGGYLMHILESASHQIPLARNLSRRDSRTAFVLDDIDRVNRG